MRLLSSANTTYNADYHAEAADGEQFAMATTFTRAGGTIRHCWSSELRFVPPEPGQNPRHVDFLWSLWSLLDRTAEGRGEAWSPQLAYEQWVSRVAGPRLRLAYRVRSRCRSGSWPKAGRPLTPGCDACT